MAGTWRLMPDGALIDEADRPETLDSSVPFIGKDRREAARVGNAEARWPIVGFTLPHPFSRENSKPPSPEG